MIRLRAIAVLAMSLSPVGASAAGQDYLRTAVPGTVDRCLFWESRRYVYSLDLLGSARTPGTDELTAIEKAYQRWREHAGTCSDFQFARGPDTNNAPVGYVDKSPNNTNVVIFRERDCDDVSVVPSNDTCFAAGTCGNQYKCWEHAGDGTIALTTTTYSIKTGIIVDADIELNAASFLFTAVDSPPCSPDAQDVNCVATDIQNTMTHEIGHAVGFDHVSVPGSTMEPSAPIGETGKRLLDRGTGSGFCDTYPRGIQIGSTCDVQGLANGNLIAVNKGTPGLSPLGCQVGDGAAALIAVLAWAFARGRR